MRQATSPSGHDIRRARPADAEQIAALFQLVYAASSHPCKRPEFVAATLEGLRPDVWHVTALRGRISGCMGMLPHRWNRSWEIVRGVTHPDFRGSGLATELAQRAVDDAWASGECDLVVGYPRNRTMNRILCEDMRPPFHTVGHDGGVNIADDRREYHLVIVSFADLKRFEHVSPPLVGAFVRDTVLAPVGFESSPGLYPPLLITGEYPQHPDYGPFTFNYHPYCPSDSLELTAYTGPKRDPAAIASDLLTTIDSFGYARHVRLTVLADKIEFQQALRSAGFAITAYLPAWHMQNGVRYDCVCMARRTTDDEPVSHDTRDLIDAFNRGYSECFSQTA
jgi:GNAT superfamily N-acetyltransferase